MRVAGYVTGIALLPTVTAIGVNNRHFFCRIHPLLGGIRRGHLADMQEGSAPVGTCPDRGLFHKRPVCIGASPLVYGAHVAGKPRSTPHRRATLRGA